MILLIGMKMSFTKNPTNPMTTKPMAVRIATFENSTTQKYQKSLSQSIPDSIQTEAQSASGQ